MTNYTDTVQTTINATKIKGL